MLQFVGVGSAFNTDLGNNSAYLKHEDTMLLIDCGGSVFDRLKHNEVLKNLKQLDVCITHTHCDHIGSLGDMIFYCFFILKMVPIIRHPEGAKIQSLLNIMGVEEKHYTLIQDETFQWKDKTISFVLEEHADNMAAYGLLFKGAEETFWFSGDSRSIPACILEQFLVGEIDYLYQDTSSMDYPGTLHLSMDRLTELIPLAYRHRVRCMHLDEAFAIEKAIANGFKVCHSIFNKKG